MKILFLSRWFPYPPDNGSKIRIFNLLKQLSARHEVELISFATETIMAEQVAALGDTCQRVEVIGYNSFQPGRLKAMLGFFSQQPRSVVDTYSPDMQRLVEQTGSAQSFDVVIASQIDMAPYAMALPGPVRIFEEIELTTLYEQFARQPDPVKKLRHGLTWWKLVYYTAHLLPAFDGCTVVSAAERERVQQVITDSRFNGTMTGLRIGLIPNGVDVAHYRADFGSPAADTLVYSGALTYQANFDAVDFFLREIFPLILAKRPQVRLLITGKTAGVPLERLPHNERVIFTGYLDDIRPTVAQSWVSIVPLRVGGGTRLKILEALALGTPVVATGKGAEGLDLTPGRDLLIADEPADFAAAVLRLLGDPTLRETLSQHGRQAVAAKYDWPIIGRQFNDFIEQVASSRVASSR